MAGADMWNGAGMAAGAGGGVMMLGMWKAAGGVVVIELVVGSARKDAGGVSGVGDGVDEELVLPPPLRSALESPPPLPPEERAVGERGE